MSYRFIGLNELMCKKIPKHEIRNKLKFQMIKIQNKKFAEDPFEPFLI